MSPHQGHIQLLVFHGDCCDLSQPGSFGHHWIIQAVVFSGVYLLLIFCSACDVDSWALISTAVRLIHMIKGDWQCPHVLQSLGYVDYRMSVLSWCWHFAGTAKGFHIHLRVLQQLRMRFPSDKGRGNTGRCKDQWNSVKPSSRHFYTVWTWFGTDLDDRATMEFLGVLQKPWTFEIFGEYWRILAQRNDSFLESYRQNMDWTFSLLDGPITYCRYLYVMICIQRQ